VPEASRRLKFDPDDYVQAGQAFVTVITAIEGPSRHYVTFGIGNGRQCRTVGGKARRIPA